MRRPEERWNDSRIEQILGSLLITGVGLAAGVVLAGGLLYLARYGGALPDYRIFHGEPADLRSVLGVFDDALDLRRRGLIQLGVLLLMATPVARVVFSVVAFVLERDWTYVGITLLVLAILTWSLLGG